jgi:hypothetical protein
MQQHLETLKKRKERDKLAFSTGINLIKEL